VFSIAFLILGVSASPGIGSAIQHDFNHLSQRKHYKYVAMLLKSRINYHADQWLSRAARRKGRQAFSKTWLILQGLPSYGGRCGNRPPAAIKQGRGGTAAS
jgi:hypothetical protein